MLEKQNQSVKGIEPTNKIGLYEKHKKIYVKSIKGWWTTWRWVFVFLTQAIFYLTPFLEWNGRQAILFHVIERKFYIFGLVLWPQDIFYLALLLIISAYSLFLFTSVAGRLFCGYACPQTVYTEVFMWIEKKFEGERNAQIKLDKQIWNHRKIYVKLLKHTIWIVLSLITGFALVAYFTPLNQLIENVITGELGPWETFWILFYAAFTYLQAGFMREQVCKYMCPYARFQSVMFDPDTMIISYDPIRGEPRGARKKVRENEVNLGACVDCGICIQVCPVGIDIRKGLQYECIGCGACIDGCDEVMDRIGLPRGLIRYTTENSLAKECSEAMACGNSTIGSISAERSLVILKKNIQRPRILVYMAILLLLVSATAISIALRVPLKVDVIRDRSSLAREADDGRIENVYTMKIMNATEYRHTYTINVSGLPDVDLVTEKEVIVEPATNHELTLGVRVPDGIASKGSHRIYFDVEARDNPKIAVHEKATFILP